LRRAARPAVVANFTNKANFLILAGFWKVSKVCSRDAEFRNYSSPDCTHSGISLLVAAPIQYCFMLRGLTKAKIRPFCETVGHSQDWQTEQLPQEMCKNFKKCCDCLKVSGNFEVFLSPKNFPRETLGLLQLSEADIFTSCCTRVYRKPSANPIYAPLQMTAHFHGTEIIKVKSLCKKKRWFREGKIIYDVCYELPGFCKTTVKLYAHGMLLVRCVRCVCDCYNEFNASSYANACA